MANLKEILTKLNNDYNQTTQNSDTSSYWNLSTTMQEFEANLREHIQEVTKADITRIIDKLKSNNQLDQPELEYVKLWIVGDADHYVKLENNYNDWVEELNRLVEEINKVDVAQPDFTTASKLRALLLDGIRVLGDIVFFIKQQQRVKDFTESTLEIDDQERDLLISLLEGKILSPNE